MQRVTSWLGRRRWSKSCLSFIEIYEIGDRNLTLQEGFVLVDTAAGHPICGGFYFDALERGLNKQGVKSVVISVDKASIPTKARGVGGTASTKENG